MRRGIENDIIIITIDRFESDFEASFTTEFDGERQIGVGEGDVGGEQIEPIVASFPDCVARLPLPYEDVREGGRFGDMASQEHERRIRLGIAIDQEDAELLTGERRGDVDRRGCFARSPFFRQPCHGTHIEILPNEAIGALTLELWSHPPKAPRRFGSVEPKNPGDKVPKDPKFSRTLEPLGPREPRHPRTAEPRTSGT